MKSHLFVKSMLTITCLLSSGIYIYAQQAELPKGLSVIVLKDGSELKNTRLWQLNSGTLEYEQNESLHDININEIKTIDIRDSSGITTSEVWFFDSTGIFQKLMIDSVISTKHTAATQPDSLLNESTVAAATPAQNKPYYDLGMKDGGIYYDGTGAAMGGLFSGLTPVFGWFITFPILASSKPQLYNEKNPHIELLANKEYRKGYSEKARAKKSSSAWGGFGIGLIAALAMIL